jgi:hypothetical protein
MFTKILLSVLAVFLLVVGASAQEVTGSIPDDDDCGGSGNCMHCSYFGPWNEIKIEAANMQKATYTNPDGFKLRIVDIEYNEEQEITKVVWEIPPLVPNVYGGANIVIWKAGPQGGHLYPPQIGAPPTIEYFPRAMSGIAEMDTYGGTYALSHLSVCYEQSPTAITLESFKASRPSILSWLMDVLNN